MSTRPLCLSLSLLASLGAAWASPATAGLSSLEERLVPPAREVSPFPIDTADLAKQICGEEGPEGGSGGRKKPNGECHAYVKYAPPPPGGRNGDASPLRMTSAEPVATSCGLWDATLTLDPVRLRPVSGEASSMVLEVSSRLRFAHQETGRTVDFTLRPGRGNGSWSLSRAGGSTVHLTVGGMRALTFDGCIPAWVYEDPSLWVDPEEGCEMCPEEDPSDEETDGDFR